MCIKEHSILLYIFVYMCVKERLFLMYSCTKHIIQVTGFLRLLGSDRWGFHARGSSRSGGRPYPYIQTLPHMDTGSHAYLATPLKGYVKPWSAKTAKVQQRNNEPKVKGSTAPIHEAIKHNMITNTF